MQPIFYPRSIVVVGVSEQPDNLASNILANLHAFGYRGELYAAGLQTGQAHGVPIVTLDQVPDGLDLAVILTPAAAVPDLMDTCGRKGIRRIVVESGGFSEFSEEGRKLELRLTEVARRWDIRFVGPNCISVVNLEAGLCLPFTTLVPQATRRGMTSIIAQSGGVSITYLDKLSASGVGVNKAVSIGNKTDLDEADYLTYLIQDPGTEIVCLYLESIGDGRQLMELARSSPKPIIVHKSNRGQASQSIARSHTAALGDDDRIVSAALQQAGIFRAQDFQESIAIAQGLALPPVRGNDVVIISRSGGHAVIAADAAERHGFHLAPLADEFSRAVRALFRANVIAPTNPLDLGTIFDFDLYARIVDECLRMLSPDAVLLINTFSLNEAEGARRLAHRVEQIARESGRPVAMCLYSQGSEAQAIQREIRLPIFMEIEAAVRGLAASRDWSRRETRRASAVPHVISTPSLQVAQLLDGSDMLTADRALTLCKAYGIPVAEWQVADNSQSAAQAADQLGYPVALKVLSAQAIHKTDVGGVALNLADAQAVQRQAETVLARVAAPATLMVQRMIDGGVEVILGGKRDHTFGPVVMFGLGGVFVEAMEDVSFRVAPVNRADAEEMISQVRGRRLLEGARGTLRTPVDREALIQAILALSRIMTENACIAEVDINPLMALPGGVIAVDARIGTV